MGASDGTVTGHSTENLLVGKGRVYTKLPGDTDFVDRGNILACTVTPKPTTLDHYSTRNGTKKKDLTVVTQQDVTVAFTMEEASADNMALMLMSAVENSPPEHVTLNIFSQPQIIGAFRFIGKNDVGPQWTINLPTVSFIPSKALDMITDGWGSMEITGDVLADDNGNFGTYTGILDSTPVAS